MHFEWSYQVSAWLEQHRMNGYHLIKLILEEPISNKTNCQHKNFVFEILLQHISKMEPFLWLFGYRSGCFLSYILTEWKNSIFSFNAWLAMKIVECMVNFSLIVNIIGKIHNLIFVGSFRMIFYHILKHKMLCNATSIKKSFNWLKAPKYIAIYSNNAWI